MEEMDRAEEMEEMGSMDAMDVMEEMGWNWGAKKGGMRLCSVSLCLCSVSSRASCHPSPLKLLSEVRGPARSKCARLSEPRRRCPFLSTPLSLSLSVSYHFVSPPSGIFPGPSSFILLLFPGPGDYHSSPSTLNHRPVETKGCI